MYTHFFTFSPALSFSIPSPKYQSQMANPLFSQYAFVTSSRYSKNAMHAFKNDTQVYYSRFVDNYYINFYFSSKLLWLFHRKSIWSVRKSIWPMLFCVYILRFFGCGFLKLRSFFGGEFVGKCSDKSNLFSLFFLLLRLVAKIEDRAFILHQPCVQGFHFRSRVRRPVAGWEGWWWGEGGGGDSCERNLVIGTKLKKHQ